MNIINDIEVWAIKNPQKTAIAWESTSLFQSKFHKLSYRQLIENSNSFANGLTNLGVQKGDKALIFLKPSLDYHAIVFAVFKLGVIPVFIDPGMGKENLLKAVEESKPKLLIAERIVHVLAKLNSKSFESAKYLVTNKTMPFSNIHSLNSLKDNNKSYETTQLSPDELSAILYTSGGTGKPKGVNYSHQIFLEQKRILQKTYKLTEDDVDLPGFPLFSLFTLAMGMKSVIPNMNPAKPSKASGRKIVKNIHDNQVTFAAGSPAIWKNVSEYCLSVGEKLPSIKYMVMFGAPVSNKIHRDFSNILDKGTTYTPYGATESLPVSNIAGSFILKETSERTNMGKGTCIGKIVEGIECKIIKVSDETITNFNEIQELNINEVGEIIVTGKVVTELYFNNEEATKKSKIYDGEKVWHRVGDLGYFDEEANLWFCGRKIHRVDTNLLTHYSVTCESIFNQHPEVERSALIGLGQSGNQKPAIVIERKRPLLNSKRKQFESELLNLAKNFEHTKDIVDIFYCPKFPVDIRHNIKINRTQLADKAMRGQL
jgi:acyl-CoA synthetase (AMP-forming)/AMP-acid ligase II